jgi:hypothetical protein
MRSASEVDFGSGIPCSTPGNSLLPILENTPDRTPRSGRIGALDRAGKPRFGRFPCTFPAYQGFRPRDEFPPDCPHRQLVRVIGDDDAGMPMPPKTPCLRGVLGAGLGEGEPETASSGLGRRRSRCSSLLPSWAVRIRFRFAPVRSTAASSTATLDWVVGVPGQWVLSETSPRRPSL